MHDSEDVKVVMLLHETSSEDREESDEMTGVVTKLKIGYY